MVLILSYTIITLSTFVFSTIVTAVAPEVRRAAEAEGDSAEIEERSSDDVRC
jgi:hypothetical protein